MAKEDFIVAHVGLSYETQPKRRISAMTALKHPATTNLELSVLVSFKNMDPLFLRLAQGFVTERLSDAVQETLQRFIDEFLELPAEESSEGVSSDG